MSLTFSIVPRTSATRNYLAISLTDGIQAIAFDPGAPFQQQIRYHHPGVAGQYLVRDGQTARDIALIVRYMNISKGLAEAAYQADCNVYSTEEVDIVALGQVYLGCNLIPGSMSRITPIRATGRTALQVFFDVTMAFTQDNPGGFPLP